MFDADCYLSIYITFPIRLSFLKYLVIIWLHAAKIVRLEPGMLALINLYKSIEFR